MCMVDYDNLPEFQRDMIYKSKRRRPCDECGGWIPPGGYYQQTSGKWDDVFKTFNACVPCMARMKFLAKECHGYVFSCVIEDYNEHFGDEEEANLKLWNELVPSLELT